MTTTCIDLRTICRARRWCWRFEDSFRAERMRSTNPDASWYAEVLCRNGIIYPYGDDVLAVSTEGHSNIPSRLQALGSEVQPIQGNVVFRFPVSILDAVAGVMKPRKKRIGNPAGVEALVRFRQVQMRSDGLESSETGRPIPTYPG